MDTRERSEGEDPPYLWILKGILYMAAGKAFTPAGLNVLVTSRCALRCRHCFFWNEADRAAPDLRLEEIERLSANLGDLLYLVLSGGEPFIRKDLPAICEVFYRNNKAFDQIILTDGYFVERIGESVEEIFRRCPEIHLTVGVSFDGLEPLHDSIRGRKGAFRKALASYRLLDALKDRHPNLQIQTCTCLMAWNQDAIFDLYEFIRDDLRPDKVALNLVRQDPRDPGSKDVEPAIYEGITRRIREDTLSGRLRNRFAHDDLGLVTVLDIVLHQLIAETVRDRRCRIRCFAGLASGVVYPDGRVLACELHEPLGNLREQDYDFRAIWFSDEARRLRARIRRGCHCTHEIDCFLPSMMFNPRIYPRIASTALRYWFR